jgi:hypothetical protein
MRIWSTIALKRGKVASIVISCAITLVCARAQTATAIKLSAAFSPMATTLPDNLVILTKPGRVPGSGLEALLRHATGCNRPISLSATSSQDSSVSGCIRGADKMKGVISVQIERVGAENIVATVANEHGEFVLDHVPAGDYVLQAGQSEKILALKTIRVPLGSAVLTDVTPRFPGVRVVYVSED